MVRSQRRPKQEKES
jgi:hypothetical protein